MCGKESKCSTPTLLHMHPPTSGQWNEIYARFIRLILIYGTSKMICGGFASEGYTYNWQFIIPRTPWSFCSHRVLANAKVIRDNVDNLKELTGHWTCRKNIKVIGCWHAVLPI